MRGVVKQAIKYDRDGIEIQFLNDPNVSTLKVRLLYCETERLCGLT